MKSILILTPFRNEDHSIPHYLKALKALDYPLELIDVYWLENDSSDNTLELLEGAKNSFNFNSLTLESVKILGSVKKRAPSGYVKDIDYGRGRIKSWLIIWNKYFLPLIRKSNADYVMAWWADAIPPKDVITQYLLNFKEVKDVGWIGGKMYRRFPRHNQILSPSPKSSFASKKIVRCKLTGHVWMMPRKPLAECKFASIGDDIHTSLIQCLEKKHGLYTYYNPKIFIEHISNDGKVHVVNEK